MKRTLSIVLALVLVFALCSSAFAAGKPITIKMVSSLSSSDPCIKALVAANEKVKELTDGNVDVQMYADGQMLMSDEGIEAMLSDAAVICVNDPLTLADYVPVFDTICAPFMWQSSKEIEAFTKTEKYAEVLEKGHAANFHLITTDFNIGARSILSNVEVRSVEDCKKLNIRLPNATVYIKLFDEFGANYQATSWNNGLTGMETKMLNGAEGTAMRMSSESVYELLDTPVFSDVRYMASPMALQISYNFWQSIPEEYRDIMTEVYTECAAEQNAHVRDNEEMYMADLEAHGVKVIRFDEIDTTGFYAGADKVCADMEDYAAIKDAVQAVRDALAAN